MKISSFSLLILVFVIAGCSPKNGGNTVVDPRYDPNNPAVQSAPQPTSTASAPAAPNAAPATYGNVTYKGAESAAVPSTYGSASMTPDMVAAPLVGSWTNKSDPEENIVFTNHSYASYYSGEMIIEEEMTYHARCPGDCSGGVSAGVPCFTISSEFGTDCYGIIRVTDVELELSIIGQSTETVTYVRSMP